MLPWSLESNISLSLQHVANVSPLFFEIFSTGSRHWLIGIYLLCLLSPFFLSIGLPQLLHHPFASFFISPILSFWYLCLPIMSRHSFPPFFSRQWLISPFASRPQDCLLILTNDIFPPMLMPPHSFDPSLSPLMPNIWLSQSPLLHAFFVPNSFYLSMLYRVQHCFWVGIILIPCSPSRSGKMFIDIPDHQQHESIDFTSHASIIFSPYVSYFTLLFMI